MFHRNLVATSAFAKGQLMLKSARCLVLSFTVKAFACLVNVPDSDWFQAVHAIK